MNKVEKVMERVALKTGIGICPPQSRIYGISHANIVNKLTRLNWRTKAIVRDGEYIYVSHTRKRVKGRINVKYRINAGSKFFKKTKPHYKHLNEAISVANSLSDKIGSFPEEFKPGPTIFIGGKWASKIKKNKGVK